MQDRRFVLALIGSLGLLGAVFIGSWLPDAGLGSLFYTAVIVLVLFYTFTLSNYAFYFALVVIMFEVQLRPFGFNMPSTVIIGALFGPVFLLSIWRKDIQSPVQVKKYSRGYRTMAAIVLTYVTIHLLYSWKDPILDFALSNVLKSYYNLVFSFILILWFVSKAPALALPKKPLIFLGKVCLAGIVFNIVVRIYGTYFMGFGTAEFAELSELTKTVIYIPILNLTENAFALRILSPLVALIAATCLTSGHPDVKRRSVRILFITLILLSALGSLISMGRATVIFSFAMIGFVFIWRRRMAFLIAFGLLGVFFIVLIRVGYEVEPTLVPLPIQRTVAMIPGMQMEKASESIEGSSNWRYELFNRALQEWHSSQRIFWFGRSTSALSNTDIVQVTTGALREAAVIDISLKRGATHNLITDYLVSVGLVGAVLFFAFWLVAIQLMIRLANMANPHSVERQLFVVAAIFTAFQLIYAVIGGGEFPVQAAVLVCFGILLLKYNKDETPQISKPTKIFPIRNYERPVISSAASVG